MTALHPTLCIKKAKFVHNFDVGQVEKFQCQPFLFYLEKTQRGGGLNRDKVKMYTVVNLTCQIKGSLKLNRRILMSKRRAQFFAFILFLIHVFFKIRINKMKRTQIFKLQGII